MRGRGRGSLQADEGLEPQVTCANSPDLVRQRVGGPLTLYYPIRMECRSKARHSTESGEEGRTRCALSWGQQGDSNVALRRGSPHQGDVQAVAEWQRAVEADWQSEQTVV